MTTIGNVSLLPTAGFEQFKSSREIASIIRNPANRKEIVIALRDGEIYKICKYSIQDNKCTEYFDQPSSNKNILQLYFNKYNVSCSKYTVRDNYINFLDISHLKQNCILVAVSNRWDKQGHFQFFGTFDCKLGRFSDCHMIEREIVSFGHYCLIHKDWLFIAYCSNWAGDKYNPRGFINTLEIYKLKSKYKYLPTKISTYVISL